MANLLKITNNKVCLIKPELRHARAIAIIENSPLVWSCSSLGDAPYTIEEIENFITASDTLQSSGQMRFLIERSGSQASSGENSRVEGRVENEIIGCLDLYGYNEVDCSAFVGIVIYPFSLHGNGYGTAAVEQLISILPTLGVKQLKVEIDPRNTISHAFFSKFTAHITQN